jgi:hypothetical protein
MTLPRSLLACCAATSAGTSRHENIGRCTWSVSPTPAQATHAVTDDARRMPAAVEAQW